MRVRGPRNHFPLVASSRYLFIAGGIGITPILPMIAEAEAAAADCRLFCNGRERASMAFVDELASYGDQVTIVPQDEMGMLDLESVLEPCTRNTLVYCCGSRGLLSAVEILQRTGRPAHFTWNGSLPSRRNRPQKRTHRSSLCWNARVWDLQVPPDKSVLDVIRAAGVSVRASCLEELRNVRDRGDRRRC